VRTSVRTIPSSSDYFFLAVFFELLFFEEELFLPAELFFDEELLFFDELLLVPELLFFDDEVLFLLLLFFPPFFDPAVPLFEMAAARCLLIPLSLRASYLSSSLMLLPWLFVAMFSSCRWRQQERYRSRGVWSWS
jgi:hypothetical protein